MTAIMNRPLPPSRNAVARSSRARARGAAMAAIIADAASTVTPITIARTMLVSTAAVPVRRKAQSAACGA